MGGSEAHPGLPLPNPTVSYWQLPPHRIANYRTTEFLPTSDVQDYIIVGSGITGAATAFKLLSRDPSLSILMLEARSAASGASGRNGGHCRAGWWSNFKRYRDAFGEDDALKFERLEEENVRDIRDFVHEHEVDCDFQDVETADVYTTESEWAEILEVVAMREETNKCRPEACQLTKRRVWDGEEARKHLGLPGILGAATYPAHTQNPYLLVCKMIELSLEKGLNLQTNTMVSAIDPLNPSEGGARWAVRTDRGLVRAKQVVLATNAFTNALHPGLSSTKFLTPGRSQVAALRPGTNMAQNPVLRFSVGMNDLNSSGDYFMCRSPGLQGEGDLLYGGGRSVSKTRERGITDDTEVNPEIATYLHHAMADFVGKQEWGDEREIIRDWCGITCYTPDTFPLVGESPGQEGLWLCVGMNGHGMAMAFRSAEALVTMMTEKAEPEWFPKCFRLARAWNEAT